MLRKAVDPRARGSRSKHDADPLAWRQANSPKRDLEQLGTEGPGPKFQTLYLGGNLA